MKAPSILLFGTGRMAYQLGHALKRAGLPPLAVAGRDLEARERLARYLDCNAVDPGRGLPMADLYILAVSDDAIAEVAPKVPAGDAVVAHTAGAMDMDVLQPHTHRGVLWPIQSLVHGAPMDLQEVPFVVDANTAHAREVMLTVAGRISGSVYELSMAQRRKVHLAAVLTSNLSAWLVREAQRLLREEKLPPSLLTPLWRSTAAKVATIGPEQALTGPARRGDIHTIQEHLALLEGDTDLRRAYALLSGMILKAYGHNDHGPTDL